MDIKLLMRQAQEMQKKMQKVQEELANSSYEGTSGGGVVKVVVTGAGIAQKISIDPSLIEKDEKEILEDLIIAAFNDAKKKSDDSSNNSVKAATNGMQLPAGFKL
ncbi:MAG: YbaB/EbfC family nucleoid-associated protein [Rickettsiales bacterium]|nr:YbaB/EbfC family nucleoid-associated protein [Rickettsiales bacterium]